jgi:hypothetical protein
MAANYWMNDAGTWRKAVQVYLNDSGTWRKAKAIWFNDGGTWRKVFSGFTANAFSVFNALAQTSDGLGSKQATCSFNSDGTFSVACTTIGLTFNDNWGLPTTTGIGSSWSIKVTVTSGAFSLSGTTGSWVSLASAWTAFKSGTTASSSVTFTVEFSPDGGATTALTVTGCSLAYNSSPA